jgi:hypothetical protein
MGKGKLVGLLSSPNQLVVAYALLTLRKMNSNVRANLTGDLANRKQKITFVAGSFLNSMDLGGLARQYRKEARRRKGQTGFSREFGPNHERKK